MAVNMFGKQRSMIAAKKTNPRAALIVPTAPLSSVFINQSPLPIPILLRSGIQRKTGTRDPNTFAPVRRFLHGGNALFVNHVAVCTNGQHQSAIGAD
jgi:hypothetical protein